MPTKPKYIRIEVPDTSTNAIPRHDPITGNMVVPPATKTMNIDQGNRKQRRIPDKTKKSK